MEIDMDINLVFDDDDLEEMIRLYLKSNPDKIGGFTDFRLDIDIDRHSGTVAAILHPSTPSKKGKTAKKSRVR